MFSCKGYVICVAFGGRIPDRVGLVIVPHCFEKYRSLWFLRVPWNPLLLLGLSEHWHLSCFSLWKFCTILRQRLQDGASGVPSNRYSACSRTVRGIPTSIWVLIKSGSSPAMGPKYLWLACFQAGKDIKKTTRKYAEKLFHKTIQRTRWWQGPVPPKSSISRLDFPWNQPSILGYPHDYGNPHITASIHACTSSAVPTFGASFQLLHGTSLVVVPVWKPGCRHFPLPRVDHRDVWAKVGPIEGWRFQNATIKWFKCTWRAFLLRSDD